MLGLHDESQRRPINWPEKIRQRFSGGHRKRGGFSLQIHRTFSHERNFPTCWKCCQRALHSFAKYNFSRNFVMVTLQRCNVVQHSSDKACTSRVWKLFPSFAKFLNFSRSREKSRVKNKSFRIYKVILSIKTRFREEKYLYCAVCHAAKCENIFGTRRTTYFECRGFELNFVTVRLVDYKIVNVRCPNINRESTILYGRFICTVQVFVRKQANALALCLSYCFTPS